MADQVAIAIENARLFEEKEIALEASRRSHKELTGRGWSEFLGRNPGLGVHVNFQDQAQKPSDDWQPAMVQAYQDNAPVLSDQGTLIVPIQIRGTTIGVIRLRKQKDDSEWIEDELDLVNELTDRLSVALENARLHNETRNRAERERLVTEISTKIRASNDPDVILQTAVKELKTALGAHQARVHFQPVEKTVSRSAVDGPPLNADGHSQEGSNKSRDHSRYASDEGQV
jgi:GAF domain-containing protein